MNGSPYFIPIFLLFFTQCPFLFQNTIQDSTLHLILMSSWLWHFLRLFLVWMTLTGKVFVEWHSAGICLMPFSWLYWGYMSLGGGPQRWSAIFITSSQGYVLSTWLIAVDIDLGPLAEGVSVAFLHCKITISSSLPILQSLEVTTMCSPPLRNVTVHLLESGVST